MLKKLLYLLLSILFIGFLLPHHTQMPVEGATKSDYNPKSFWYYPWGTSITHKGIDIFAKLGTPLRPTTSGWVLYSGTIQKGGKVVFILSSKWRVHYYAHLQSLNTKTFDWVGQQDLIGTVGTSGNAKGKPPHLHYSIVTIFPYFWRIDKDRQGWKKMFYLNPMDYL